MTPGRKPHSHLRRKAHRHGIARLLNSSYTGGRLVHETVETALPFHWLARYAAGHYGMKVLHVTPYGRLRRRWVLTPRSSYARPS